MAESIVSFTYATALYEAAVELDKAELILNQVTALSHLIEEEREFAEFLNSPAIASAEKKDTVGNIFRDKICNELINFIYILIDKNRTNQIKRIAKHYRLLYDKAEGIAEGYIFSTVNLTNGQLKKFNEQMSRLLQKKIKLKNIIDESLLGGIKIQVDGKMIDQSLKAGLDRMLEDINK